MSHEHILWVVFGGVLVFMLGLDLGVVNRRAHEVKMREALIWSGIWIGVALAFNVFVYFMMGLEPALQFLTGYLIEKSLSVDNLFVFLMIFGYFQVPAKFQHRVLFWGIMGAIVMRLIFIMAGVTLVEKLDWVIYLFGAFLIFTGLRMAMKTGEAPHPERNLILRLFRPITDFSAGYESGRFFLRKNRRLMFTPLFIVLLMIETSDLMFAIDSVPAIIAISRDPFIIYSSNILAILGLRALYFALAGLMGMFYYLKYGLAVLLSFVGVKMLLHDLYKLPITLALGFIAVTLLVSILASIIHQRHMTERLAPPGEPSPAGSSSPPGSAD